MQYETTKFHGSLFLWLIAHHLQHSAVYGIIMIADLKKFVNEISINILFFMTINRERLSVLVASAYTSPQEVGTMASGIKPFLDTSRFNMGSLEGFIVGRKVGLVHCMGRTEFDTQTNVYGVGYSNLDQYLRRHNLRGCFRAVFQGARINER